MLMLICFSFLPISWAFQPAFILRGSRPLPSSRGRASHGTRKLPSFSLWHAQRWDDPGPDGLYESFQSQGFKPLSRQPNDRLEFPYGISNFAELRSKPNFFYVDKTSVIRELEMMPSHIIFHRPPRWGKSLMMSMLEYYYDISQAVNFQSLFGDLEIGTTPTSLKNAYHVLSIDLSINVDFSSQPSDILDSLKAKLLDCVQDFASRYGFPVPQTLDSSFGLRTVARNVQAANGRLLILIDEYDRFANKMMFENPEAYNKIVVGVTGVPRSSPIRGFFESIKEISKICRCRSIVTGITPIALADASGANLWMDVSLLDNLGDAFGFCEDDLWRALDENGMDEDHADSLLGLMRDYYNGFRFPGSSSPYYNPALALFFLWSYFTSAAFRNRVDNFLIFGLDDLSQLLLDTNVVSSENVFALLCKSPCMQVVYSKLLNEQYPITLRDIPRKMRLSELLDSTSSQVEQEQLAAAFLYYHGLATIASSTSPYRLQVPNELIRGPFLVQLGNYFRMSHSDIACFRSPNADSLQRYLEGIVKTHETLKSNSFSEAALQCELEFSLRAISTFVGGFFVKSERKAGNGYCDLLVGLSDGSGVVFEIKRVRPNAINYSSFSAHERQGLPENTQFVNWQRNEFKAAEDLLSGLAPEELRALRIVIDRPDWYMNAKSVGELESNAAAQGAGYLNSLMIRYPGKRIKAFTLIQVGWRLLVKEIPSRKDYVKAITLR